MRTDVPRASIDQAGTFTRGQSYGEGWTPRQVRRRLTNQRWKVVAGEALGAWDLTIGPRQLGFAVILTWPEAIISHQLAGVLHGLPLDLPRHGTATVSPGRALRARGLTAHRTSLQPRELDCVVGLPVTSELRTSMDLLAHLPWDDARSLWAWLVTRRRLTTADLEAAIEERARKVGTNQLRRLLAAGRTGSLSAAEDVFHDLLSAAGLTGWRANSEVVVGGRCIAVVDVLFDAQRVAVEIDGFRTHGSAEAFQRDRTRQNQLVAAGYTVLRFTWADLHQRPQQVIATLRSALDRYSSRERGPR